MGEAKRRGSYEARATEAVAKRKAAQEAQRAAHEERQRLALEERAKRDQTRPSAPGRQQSSRLTGSRIALSAAMALAMMTQTSSRD